MFRLLHAINFAFLFPFCLFNWFCAFLCRGGGGGDALAMAFPQGLIKFRKKAPAVGDDRTTGALARAAATKPKAINFMSG